MLDELRSIDVSNAAVRKFGYLMAAVSAAASVFIIWRSGGAPGAERLWIPGAGCLLAVVGRFLPRILRPVYRLWMMLAVVLGFVMTRIILGIVFICVVTPIGIVMRMLGRDPLRKHPDASADSYWIDRDSGFESPEDASSRMRRYY
jgi:hypothetical protein